jgi:hypothetical protein
MRPLSSAAAQILSCGLYRPPGLSLGQACDPLGTLPHSYDLTLTSVCPTEQLAPAVCMPWPMLQLMLFRAGTSHGSGFSLGRGRGSFVVRFWEPLVFVALWWYNQAQQGLLSWWLCPSGQSRAQMSFSSMKYNFSASIDSLHFNIFISWHVGSIW